MAVSPAAKTDLGRPSQSVGEYYLGIHPVSGLRQVYIVQVDGQIYALRELPGRSL